MEKPSEQSDQEAKGTPSWQFHGEHSKRVNPPATMASDLAAMSGTPASPPAAAPAPDSVAGPAAPGVPPAGAPAHAHTNAGTIILQWLTYAFWGWTVLILSFLTYNVLSDFISGDGSSVNYYLIAALAVLLPISLICDYFYAKGEPVKKTGAAMVVMVIHAVIFALLGIGSLLGAAFSLVALLTSHGSSGGVGFYDQSTTHQTATIYLIGALIVAVFYAITFARTINPASLKWIVRAYKLAMPALIIILIVLGVIGAHKHGSLKHNPNYNNDYSNSDPSTPAGPAVEELNKQGQRRPVQYVHICDTAGGIEYVSQGTPKCLGSDTFNSDYDSSAPGTEFSSPCKTTSGTTRYVYISNYEGCPSGTTLLFYNSLGGSTSGPSGSNSTKPPTASTD